MIAGEGDVAIRYFDQRLSERLDQQVVDAELDAAAFEAGVELAAELEQRIELDVDGEVDVRDLLLRLGEAAGASAFAAGAASPAAAPSRSAFTTRPLGPEPCSADRSMPFCSARRATTPSSGARGFSGRPKRFCSAALHAGLPGSRASGP